MDKGLIRIYYGEGKGKSAAAIGQAILAAGQKKSVIIIQFLKGKNLDSISFMQRLEPEIKLFHFEKSDSLFEELSAEEKREETYNIKNGLNFGKKVLQTGECSILILDEILGVLEHGIISLEELQSVIEAKGDGTELILTGTKLEPNLTPFADEIFELNAVKTIVDNDV